MSGSETPSGSPESAAEPAPAAPVKKAPATVRKKAVARRKPSAPAAARGGPAPGSADPYQSPGRVWPD
jgi:hypothetical protein